MTNLKSIIAKETSVDPQDGLVVVCWMQGQMLKYKIENDGRKMSVKQIVNLAMLEVNIVSQDDLTALAEIATR